MDGGLSSGPLAADAPGIGSTGRHPFLVCTTRRVATLHHTARQLLRHHLRPARHRHHRPPRRPFLRAHHLLRSRQQLPPAQRRLPLLPDGHQHLQRRPQPRRAHPRHSPRVVLFRGYRRQQRKSIPSKGATAWAPTSSSPPRPSIPTTPHSTSARPSRLWPQRTTRRWR